MKQDRPKPFFRTDLFFVRVALCVLCSALLAPSWARAEERLVVGVTTGDAVQPSEAQLKLLEDALEREGMLPVPREVAQVRFLRHVSRPAPSFDRHELDNLPKLTDSALRNLARGRYGAAKKELSQAMELGDRGLLTIAREERRAKEIFDICLYLVRAHWEVGRHEQAREQALRCRRLFPDLLPTSHQKHTPEVRTLMREADEQLSHGPRGALRVTSSPAGCAMRLGGIQMGTTPVVVEDLASQTYRVQIECGPNGQRNVARVYAVAVNDRTAELHVDVSLDRALAGPIGRQGRELALYYPDVEQTQARLASHAKVLLEELGYDELWFLGELHGVFVLSRATHHGLTSEPVGPAADEHPVAAYVRAIRALSGAHVEPSSKSKANATALQDVDRNATHVGDGADADVVAGVGLLGAGVVTLGAAWALHFDRASAGNAWAQLSNPAHPDYLAREQAWLDKRWSVWLVGGAGSLSASVGAGLLAGRVEASWWSWALGGIGLALGGWGVIEMAGGALCDPAVGTFPDVCVEDEERIGRGLLLASTGLPLVSVALSAALFGGAVEGRRTQLSLEMTQSRAMLRLGGSL